MRRVAVIGAGASGLGSIKTCLEDGLEPVCFEKTSHIGGLWYFSDEPKTDPNGPAIVHDRMHTIGSKGTMGFSDYPFPKSLPPYPKACHVYDYYVSYAKHFGLVKYIKFNTEVIAIRRADDYLKSGQWCVTVRDSSAEVSVTVFDAVMVCSGLHYAGNMTDCPGLDNFKGDILHSCQMTSASRFKDKTVLVVGSSFTASDISCSLSEHAKQVYLSMRNGSAIIPGVLDQRPFVDALNKRCYNLYPTWYRARSLVRNMESYFDYSRIGIRSHKKTNGLRPLFGHAIGLKIFNGDVAIRSGVSEFQESKVTFVDGSEIDDVDSVIFATGYDVKFPFLEKEIICDGYSGLELYQMVFPPMLEHPTLAFVGFGVTFLAHNIMCEIQARVASKVFKKEVTLPSHKDMDEEITGRMDALYQQFGDHAPFILDPTSYQDSLARSIGALPSMTKLVLTDPKLAYKFYFGTNFPACYRLVGPGSKPGAREAFLESEENQFHGIHVKTVRKDVLPKLQRQADGLPLIYLSTAIICALVLFLCVF